MSKYTIVLLLEHSERRSLSISRRYLSPIMGAISIALALGWGKYVGKMVYLPSLDYFDVALGALVGVYLIWIWIVEYRAS